MSPGRKPTRNGDGARLLWLDIDGRKLHQLDRSGKHTATTLDSRVTAVVPHASGGLTAAVDCSVAHLDEQGQVGGLIGALPRDGDGLTDDGRCDPLGRLWVGTIDRSGARRASLFCVDAEGMVTKVLGEVALSNGLDWSSDGRICHFVDSFDHSVRNLHLGPDGLPDRVETFVQIEALPDGLTVDADGGVWVALWDGGAVHRYTPDDRLDCEVVVRHELRVRRHRPFDARHHDGARGLSADDLRRMPTAGVLFAADVSRTECGYTPFGSPPVADDLTSHTNKFSVCGGLTVGTMVSGGIQPS